MGVETINHDEALSEDDILGIARVEAKNLQKEIEKLPGKLTIEVKPKDTLGSIIRREIYKYYPNLSDEDKKGRRLANQISQEIIRQNKEKITNPDEIKSGIKLSISTVEVTSIIDGYLFSINGGGEIPESLDVEIKKEDTLGSIVRREIYKYYPELTENDKHDRKLINQIIQEIIRQNKITNPDKIQPGNLSIDMLKITPLINDYLNKQDRLNDDDIKEIPESFTYIFKDKDTLAKVIRENVYKYYPELAEILDKGELDKLMKEIAKSVMKLNGIKNEKKIAVGKEITFNMVEITKIINKFKSKHIDEIPDTFRYIIKQEDTLGSIVRREIYKYYPNLTLEDQSWKLTNQITQEIIRQNKGKITNPNEIQPGTELSIEMKNVTKIIQDYLGKESSGNEVEEIETIGTNKYITLSSTNDFKNGKGLINRLWCSNNDSNGNPDARSMILSALSKGKKVLVPSYLENEKSRVLKLEEIIKPDKIIDNKLKGKKFVLDPGHGFNDSGAMGLIDTGNDTQTMTFESAISMDVAYRVAKLLKSHGATVEFTHYIPTRGISNLNDLPPCLQYVEGKEGKHQDKRTTNQGNTTGFVSQSTSVNTRVNITNGINNNGNVDMLMSLHMNSALNAAPGSGNQVHIGKENNTQKWENSKKFALHLQSNKIGTKKEAGWGVVNRTQCPSVLIEMGNIKSNEDSKWFRSGAGRQNKAEQIVDAMVKYY